MKCKRLSIKITVSVFSLALAVSGIMAYISYFRIHDSEIASARTTLMELGQTVLHSAAIAAYLDNQEIANDVVQGLVGNQMVGGVALKGKSGFSVKAGSPPAGDEEHWVILVLTSPFATDEQVGELQIFPKWALIEERARSLALERVVLMSGYTMLIAMFVLASIQHLFVRALKQVADDLHSVIPGESPQLQPPAGHAHDEIGNLVEDINALLELVRYKLDSERELRQIKEHLERRYRMIYDRAGVGIFLLDAQEQLVMANEAFYEIAGHDKDRKRLLTNLEDIFGQDGPARDMIVETMHSGRMTSGDLRLKGFEDSAPHWAACLFSRLREDDDAIQETEIYIQGIMSDISQRKEREKTLKQQAQHDPLTGLLNRRSLEQTLALMLDKSCHSRTTVAVCLVDLDDFKPINDTHGHDAGDVVLVTIARRMQESVRDSDVVARLGGDEFICAIAAEKPEKAIRAVAGKFLRNLTRPIPLKDDLEVTVGVSIGIGVACQGEDDLKALMTMADRAMYLVKKEGKNNFLIYDDSMA